MKPIHLIPLAAGEGALLAAGAVRPEAGSTPTAGAASASAPLGDGAPGLDLLEFLAASLARTFHTPCRIRPETVDVSRSRDRNRGQFHSTMILQQLERNSGGDARVLGVAACDLFVPVLTFVFGEAQLDGCCAVVSTARLEEEHYGMPHNEALLRERLVKEAVHELGHTFGLRHCMDWRCVMASSHAVERLDVKTADFCAACRRVVAGDGVF